MIELRNLHKSYFLGPHEVHALRGVTLTIEEGDFVAIMGPSGSGKSTLMHVLGLLDIPSSGAYLLDGVDISAVGEDELAERRRGVFGFVFQQFHLLSRMTAVDNVSLPLIYSRRRTDPELARELL